MKTQINENIEHTNNIHTSRRACVGIVNKKSEHCQFLFVCVGVNITCERLWLRWCHSNAITQSHTVITRAFYVCTDFPWQSQRFFFFVVAWLLLKFSSEHVYILFIAPIEGEVVVAVKCTQRNGVRPPFAYGWWIKIAFAFGCRCFCFHIFLFRSVPSAHGRHTRARTGTVCVCNLTWSALAYALCGGTRFRIFLYGRWCGFVRLWQAIQLENIYIYIYKNGDTENLLREMWRMA